MFALRLRGVAVCGFSLPLFHIEVDAYVVRLLLGLKWQPLLVVLSRKHERTPSAVSLHE